MYKYIIEYKNGFFDTARHYAYINADTEKEALNKFNKNYSNAIFICINQTL